MLKQISVYAENRKGTMQNITQILADAQINIWGSCTSESAEFGVNRMVVSDPERAMEELENAGYLCRLTQVIGVELADEVGMLNHLLLALSESNININYLYLSFNRDSGKPVMVMHTEDTAEVASCIKAKGFPVL